MSPESVGRCVPLGSIHTFCLKHPHRHEGPKAKMDLARLKSRSGSHQSAGDAERSCPSPTSFRKLPTFLGLPPFPCAKQTPTTPRSQRVLTLRYPCLPFACDTTMHRSDPDQPPHHMQSGQVTCQGSGKETVGVSEGIRDLGSSPRETSFSVQQQCPALLREPLSLLALICLPGCPQISRFVKSESSPLSLSLLLSDDESWETGMQC